MEMTKAYITEQINKQELYEQYKKMKTHEFIKAMESGMGKHMTYKEEAHLKFAFRRGMDLISKNGTFLSKEIIHDMMKYVSFQE